MSGEDGEPQSESLTTGNGALVQPTAPLRMTGVAGLVPRLAELAVLLVAIIGAVALGLGISDYLSDHRFILGYLLAYAGFRIADVMLRADGESTPERDTPNTRWSSELPILILFAAAPFERTYIYGGEGPESVAAFGLLMELVGLWIVIGARVQLRFSASSTAPVRSGFFRYIRHPIFAGSDLVLLAWPLEFGAPIGLVVTALILFFATQRDIGKDEAEMIARFGEQYETYVRETDRLIPSVW